MTADGFKFGMRPGRDAKSRVKTGTMDFTERANALQLFGSAGVTASMVLRSELNFVGWVITSKAVRVMDNQETKS